MKLSVIAGVVAVSLACLYADPRPVLQTIDLHQYRLTVAVPHGWTVTSDEGTDVMPSDKSGIINLDWYRPYPHRTYDDFQQRVMLEAKRRRASNHDVRTRWLRVGPLRAAEIRSAAGNRFLAETFLDVPLKATPGGELFVIMLSTDAGRARQRNYREYEALLRTIRVRAQR